MTETFEIIVEQKKAAIIKVMEGLQELEGQPVIWPPDEELRKCSSPELVYLIALKEKVEALLYHARIVSNAIHNVSKGVQITKEVLDGLGKLDDSKGGASIGW